MYQNISILGCGWLGMALALALIKKGSNVKGSVTSNKNFDRFKSNELTPFKIDIRLREDMSDFLSSELLIILITSKIIDDYHYLIDQIEKSDISKVIFISSTSVYPDCNGVVDEESETKNSALAEIESLFRKSPQFQSTVIRFGGLFGYDRQPGNFIKDGKKIKNPEGYINFIHRDDCIQIIEKLLEKNIWNHTLNACADSHPKRREFYKKAYNKLARPDPIFDETALTSFKIVDSEKLKSLLNYRFKYSDLMDY